MGNSCGCSASGVDNGASQLDVMNYADALHAFQCRLSPDTKRRLYLDAIRSAIVSRRRERSFSVQPSWQEVDPTGVHAALPAVDVASQMSSPALASVASLEPPTSSFHPPGSGGVGATTLFQSNLDGDVADPITASDLIGCIHEHHLAPGHSGRSGSTTVSNNGAASSQTGGGGAKATTSTPSSLHMTSVPIVTPAAASRLFKSGDLDRKRVPVEMEEVTYERIVAALVRACDELIIPHVLAGGGSRTTSSSSSSLPKSSTKPPPPPPSPPQPNVRLLRASWLATIENAVEFPTKISSSKKKQDAAAASASSPSAVSTRRGGGAKGKGSNTTSGTKGRNKNSRGGGFSSAESSGSGGSEDSDEDDDDEHIDFTTIFGAGGGGGKHDEGGTASSSSAVGENVPTVRQYPSTTVEVAFYEPAPTHSSSPPPPSPTPPSPTTSTQSLFHHLNSYFCSRPSLPTDHPLFRGLYRKQESPANGDFALPQYSVGNSNSNNARGGGGPPPPSHSAPTTSTGDASLDALLAAILGSGSLPTVAEDIGEHSLSELLDLLNQTVNSSGGKRVGGDHGGGGGGGIHPGFQEEDLPYGIHLRNNMERAGSRPDIHPSKVHLLDDGESALAAAAAVAAAGGGGGSTATASADTTSDISSWVNQYLAAVDLRHLVAWPPSACIKAPTVLTLPGSPFQVLSKSGNTNKERGGMGVMGGGGERLTSLSSSMSQFTTESEQQHQGGSGDGGGSSCQDVTVLIMFYHRRDRTQTGLKTNARETRDARKWSALTQEDEPRRLFRPMGHTADSNRPVGSERRPGEERLPAAAPAKRGGVSASAAALASDPATQRVSFRAVKRSLQGTHHVEREDRRMAELAHAIPDVMEAVRTLVPPLVRVLVFDDQPSTAASIIGFSAGGVLSNNSIASHSSSRSNLSIPVGAKGGGGGGGVSHQAMANPRTIRFVKRLKTTILKTLFTAEPLTRLGWLLNSPYLLSTSQSSALRRIAFQQANSAELRGDAVEVVVEALCLHLRVDASSSSSSGSAVTTVGDLVNPMDVLLGSQGATSVSELLHGKLLNPLIPTETALNDAIMDVLAMDGGSSFSPSDEEDAVDKLLFVHGRTQAAFKRLEGRLQGGQGGGVDAASYKQLQQQKINAAAAAAGTNANNSNNASSTAGPPPANTASSSHHQQPPLAGCSMSSATTSSLRTSLAHPLALTGYLLQEEIWMRDLFELSST